MAVRTDVTVDFNSSPRIATVASPSVEITIQDLHDTLRTIEAYVWNMSFPKIIDSFGKQDLGGNTLVGITSVLKNIKLAFEARAGPSFIICTVRGGNLVATDINGASMSPIQPTAYVQVVIAQSTSAVIVQDVAEWTQTEKDTHISTTTNIPANIWDRSIALSTIAGSFGKKLVDVLKLKRTRP